MNAAAKAEMTRGPGWRLMDAKAATNRRRRSARVVNPDKMTFTSDPQAAAPTGYTGSHLAH